MTDTSKPPKGSMVVYDYALPPLPPGRYRLEAETRVHTTTNVRDGHTRPEDNDYAVDNDRYFDVVGPRFSLNPGDIAGVVPPSNAQGPFASMLPQIVLRRRTLPWERQIAASLPQPSNPNSLPRQDTSVPTPWLALLLLQEGEDYELKPNLPLQQVLPSDRFQAIGSPQNVLVKALDIGASLLRDILPSREELMLLTHVRQVDPDDRELSVEGSDGFFSVVVCNRLPLPDAKARAVLVSLEGRTDLLEANPPSALRGGRFGEVVLLASDLVVNAAGVRAIGPPQLAPEIAQDPLTTGPRLDAPRLFKSALEAENKATQFEDVIMKIPLLQRHRLVVLHDWGFSCDGPADFMGLMQKLDVGLIGKAKDNRPRITDTGHLPVTLGTRAGTREQVLYRGPLVPFPLTRDTAGPYHSADQARRVSPETGVEDISYASAFEVGRLLAAADARLAQELMRWRRASYRHAARLDTLVAVEKLLNVQLAATLEAKLTMPVLPIAADRIVEAMVAHAPSPGDVYGLGVLSQVPGLQAANFAAAFNLTDVTQAKRVLVGSDTPLATPVGAIGAVVRGHTGLEGVLGDSAGLSRLATQRVSVLDNVKLRMAVDVAGVPDTQVPRGKAVPRKAAKKKSSRGGTR